MILKVGLIAQNEHRPHSEYASVILQLRLENKGLTTICMLVALVEMHRVVLVQVKTLDWADFFIRKF